MTVEEVEISCDENAECKNRLGVRDCYCKEGFEGDAYQQCNRKLLTVHLFFLTTFRMQNIETKLLRDINFVYKAFIFLSFKGRERQRNRLRVLITILLTGSNACESNPCNAAASECVDLQNGDYQCECKDGFEDDPDNKGKACIGKDNFYHTFNVLSFREKYLVINPTKV